MRSWIVRIVAELRGNFHEAFSDLWKGRKFWAKIGVLLARTIVGASYINLLTFVERPPSDDEDGAISAQPADFNISIAD